MNKEISKKKKKFSNLIVILAVVHLDLFVVCLFLMGIFNFQISDTAITCFFSFWGLEMLSLAGIKICKSRYNNTYEENIDAVIEENNEESLSEV